MIATCWRVLFKAGVKSFHSGNLGKNLREAIKAL